MPDSPRLFDPGAKCLLLSVGVVGFDGLYGRFSYRLELTSAASSPHSSGHAEIVAINEERLTLLYGKNGSGKTTLLRALFHALSPAGDQGHRTALFRTPFRRLEIFLRDSTRISYSRNMDNPVGRFNAEIVLPTRRKPITWDYKDTAGFPDWRPHAGGIGEITYSLFESNDQEKQFLQVLQELAVNPVFLGDSRAITGDALKRGDRAGNVTMRPDSDVDDLLREVRDLDVRSALLRVSRYLSQLTFAGAQEGSQRVDSVYVNVLGAIASAPAAAEGPSHQAIPDLAARVSQVGVRAQRFFDYGLLPEFPTKPLIGALERVEPSRASLLERVLNPYLEGMGARMDALEEGLRSVASFVDALNSFLEKKRAEFRLSGGGVLIVDRDTGERLDPAVLSSGEKQIVLLFSDITALQGDTRLFIIDEPELSLNPEWQRTLMPRLLEVTEHSGMQLLAATHSIEIMARYRNRIRQLDA
jgi:energy-coupling factor transporter ATP-binding protein EcfA2